MKLKRVSMGLVEHESPKASIPMSSNQILLLKTLKYSNLEIFMIKLNELLERVMVMLKSTQLTLHYDQIKL